MNAKMMAVAMGCVAAISAGAATFSLAPVDSGKPKAAKTGTADASIVKVTGRGVGSNRAAALKDAYRDAVERAVGLYVDAEQMVKNDEIVSDKILTQSNAYIEKCDVVKETTENGMVTIKILAEVKRRDLVKRITDTMPPQTYKLLDGGTASAHANMVSEAKRNADAAALVNDFLKDFDPVRQLMTVGLVSSKPKILKGSQGEDSVDLAYLMKIELNRKKYFDETMPKLKQILDQISLTPPKTVRFADLIQKMKLNQYSQFYSSYKVEYVKERHGDPWNFSEFDGCYAGLHALSGNIFGCTSGLDPYLFSNFDYENSEDLKVNVDIPYNAQKFQDCQGEVFLVTAVNATSVRALRYTVDSVVARSIVEWQRKMRAKAVEYAIVFKNAQGEEIGGFPWMFEGYPNSGQLYKGIVLLMNTGFIGIENWDLNEKRKASMRWFVTPFVGCWADQYIEWRTFAFKSDDIADIASVSIELAE